MKSNKRIIIGNIIYVLLLSIMVYFIINDRLKDKEKLDLITSEKSFAELKNLAIIRNIPLQTRLLGTNLCFNSKCAFK